MAARTKHPQYYTDDKIVELFFEKLEGMKLSSLDGIGFVVGWLHTVAQNGTTSHTASGATLQGYTVEEGGN